MRLRSTAVATFFIGHLGIAFCFSLARPNAASAQMIQNGSFENPALVGTKYVSGSGANWTATAGAFVLTNDFGFGITPFGNQWEEFANNTTDTQTISDGFVTGTPYTLSLVASDVSGSTGDQLTLSVSGSATAGQTFPIPARTGGQNPGALQFASYALTFTPMTAGPVTVTLAAGSSGGGIAIDNVQLTVPEPSTWTLLLAVAVLLSGWAQWHRRRDASVFSAEADAL